MKLKYKNYKMKKILLSCCMYSSYWQSPHTEEGNVPASFHAG